MGSSGGSSSSSGGGSGGGGGNGGGGGAADAASAPDNGNGGGGGGGAADAGPRVRIGMDVGGTFTKGVAIDMLTGRLLAASTVPTTHASERGVSEGIVDALGRIMRGAGIRAGDIDLVSHSTTQAINALLESDTHKVGIVAMGVGPEKGEVVKRTRLDGRGGQALAVRAGHRFLDTSHLITEGEVRAAVEGLRAEGAEAIVATEAYGVDDPSNERFVADEASKAGMLATASHEISGVYGLEIRTLTAAVNASVMPKTLEVARYVEDAVRGAGVASPLMIMKGDGGVTSMDTFRTRPILTVLSGPAASVAGALLYLRIADGIFVEVGGTSTNVCVIRNGRPEMRYVTIRGHPTCVRSMDVRVLGVAGGSMVAVGRGRVSRVGPRSAHIAGLRYACHAPEADVAAGELVLVSPREGDAPEYAAVRCAGGGTYAITNTCAANALGHVEEGDYARADAGAARAALAKLGAAIGGVSYSEAATSVLQTASFEVTRTVTEILREFKMRRESTRIVGGGGGASVLVPFVARQLGMAYDKAEHAEVISSIGVACSMMREESEVSVVDPSPGRVSEEHRRVRAALVERGAVPESVVVDSEFVPEKSLLRVTAVGSAAMDAAASSAAAGSPGGGGGGPAAFTPEESRRRAAETMGIDEGSVDTTAEFDHHLVFTGHVATRRLFTKGSRHSVVVMDRYGRAKIALGNARVILGGRLSILEELDDFLETRPSGIAPRVCLVNDAQMMDFSGLTSPAHTLEAVMAEIDDGGRAAVIVDMS